MGSVIATRQCCLCGYSADVIYPDDWNGDPHRDPDIHPPLIPFTKGINVFAHIPGRRDSGSAHDGMEVMVKGESKPLTYNYAVPAEGPIFPERPDWEDRAQAWAAKNPKEAWAFVCEACLA